MRSLKDRVIVVTGASSGIGRATALEATRQGAHVVLAARASPALEEAAEACRTLGGRGAAVPTDVTRPEEVEALARAAVAAHGRIDVWVNNAAVAYWGRLEATPLEDWRRVIEVNVFGQVHGARAVLPIFRAQGEGVLINVASIVGRLGMPLASAYGTSKAAILGLSACLRHDLRGTGVRVVAILPATIDTPIFQHAGNVTGQQVVPVPPVVPPERVARAILRAAVRPRDEVVVGGVGKLLKQARRLVPATTERVYGAVTAAGELEPTEQPPHPGNLYEPEPELDRTDGGWRARYARRRRLAGTAVAASLVAAATAAARRLRR